MRIPSVLKALLPSSVQTYDHEFLILGVPREKYGQHTALVYHPSRGFRVDPCSFGRMTKEIANAQMLGEIRMHKPYVWEELEQATDPFVETHESRVTLQGIQILGCDGRSLFQYLQIRGRSLRGDNVVDVAVYLVKVTTNRRTLLYDGESPNLPSGYLTHYISKTL